MSLSKDYRLPENRREYFTALYRMNLEHRVMPGLVYLYMPELARVEGWDNEQKLWFAFLNGNTQNPITSYRIFREFPERPRTTEEFKRITDYFNDNWGTLSFDQDRRHQKRDFPDAVVRYHALVREVGSQEALLTGDFDTLWNKVFHFYYGFGRLASFSYLEYVKIMGFGDQCTNLFLEDKSGSKSHRNGLLFLLGMDELVWDKRLDNGHTGEYENFKKMCSWLGNEANAYLRTCGIKHEDLGYFTLESNLCTFKNSFFRRRYPGVYADMAWDRIKWYEERGMNDVTKPFRKMREALPDWLREECEDKPVPRDEKASKFADTGVPFRAEHFMEA